MLVIDLERLDEGILDDEKENRALKLDIGFVLPPLLK